MKGRGGALLREKMVEEASKRFAVVVDESKMVKRLGGSGVGVPVEVVPFCWKYTLERLERLFSHAGCVGKLRRRRRTTTTAFDEEAYITVNANYIVDLYFEREINIDGNGDLKAVSDAILRLPGVVEHGLFLDMASTLFLAGQDGVVVKNKD